MTAEEKDFTEEGQGPTADEKRRMVRRDAMLAMVEIVQRVRSDPANCRGEDILAAPEAAKVILARY